MKKRQTIVNKNISKTKRKKKAKGRYAFDEGYYAEAEADGKVVGYNFERPPGWEY